MKNIRRSAFGATGDNEDSKDKITSYCPNCIEAKVYELLKERIYGQNETIPEDNDNWLQCHRCGLVIAKVHAQQESKLKGFVDIEGINPLDPYKVMAEPINQRKIIRRFVKPIDTNEKVDPDVKAAKQKGYRVSNITELR